VILMLGPRVQMFCVDRISFLVNARSAYSIYTEARHKIDDVK
jgi:hypothetical protein